MRLILLVLVIKERWIIVLGHVLLRWLVYIHGCHLLLSGLSLGLCLGSLSLLLLFSLLTSLDALELIEHILVM